MELKISECMERLVADSEWMDADGKKSAVCTSSSFGRVSMIVGSKRRPWALIMRFSNENSFSQRHKQHSKYLRSKQ